MANPPLPEVVPEEDLREWTFQLNMVGLVLLLFATGYIGKHLALLLPVPAIAQGVFHYLGELTLTVVTVVYAFSKAWVSSPRHRHRVAWLERSTVCFYLGMGAVLVNLILLAIMAFRKFD